MNVNLSTVNRAIKDFYYTIKRLSVAPERRNCISTIDIRYQYSERFRELEDCHGSESFIFIDEVGFKIETRPGRGRSLVNTPAYHEVPQIRSKNMSVIAAMNKNQMIYCKVFDNPVNAVNFQFSIDEIKTKCSLLFINNPIFVMDNARIHHASTLSFGDIIPIYLPPYSPFLNPIENAFSKWKNCVNHGISKNRTDLIENIRRGFEC
ncbi:hypothetical protein DMUE_1847, partial [Dictyocoela muelleri]